MFDDDDVVREMWRKTPRGERKQQWKPSIAEWTPEMRALAMIHDRLGDIAQSVMSTIQTKSGKPPKYKGQPFPQPETRMEVIEREETRETSLWLMSQFTPHAGLWDTPDTGGAETE